MEAQTETDAAFDRAIEYASKRGTDDGTGAGAWYAMEAFGGRASGNTAETARVVAQGIADGDPAILDGMPYPDLSGEWAGALTGPELVTEAMGEVGYGSAEDDREEETALRLAKDWFADICDAYEAAYSTAAQDEIDRLARLEIAD